MKRAVRPGVTTRALDEVVRIELSKAGAVSTAKGYARYDGDEGFPGHCCVSVNEQVLHAPPAPRALREGDVVTLDVGLRLRGYCASARSPCRWDQSMPNASGC